MDKAQVHNISKLIKIHRTMLFHRQGIKLYLQNTDIQMEYRGGMMGELDAWTDVIPIVNKKVRGIKGTFRVSKVLKILSELQTAKEVTTRMMENTVSHAYRNGVLRVYETVEHLLKEEFEVEAKDYLNYTS